MKENKLLASVALFRELYDSDKDIYDVIGELLKAAIVFEKKWSFNTTEATQLLDTTFGFIIPEAVVRTTLRNRLKKQANILSFQDGIYSLVSEEIKKSQPLALEIEVTRTAQSKIIDNLFLYIKKRSTYEINEQEESKIMDDFSAYLLNNKVSAKYSNLISSYIIETQSETGFTKSLNAVREGFVLYEGIGYSSNLNDLGKWNTVLTIYLDTEHLFNATGYSGTLHKQLFDDFHGLVNEINQSGKNLISLKYFEECGDEVDNFFHVAELIINGKLSLDPSKKAMQNVLNGAKQEAILLQLKRAFIPN